MLRGLGLALFAMSLAPLADAQTTEPLPAGWERPTKADLGGANPDAASSPNYDWQARLKNKYRYVRAEGDFNGDDKWDRAEMLVNRKAQTYATFAFLSGQNEPIKLDEGPIRQIAGHGIATGKPGRRQTTCGKGYGCQKGDVPFIDLRFATIESFHFESSSSEFYWTGEKFEQFWTSD